jgi:signal transduction histidine kinase
MPSWMTHVDELLFAANTQLTTNPPAAVETLLSAIDVLKVNQSAADADRLLSSAYLLAAQAYRNLGKLQAAVDYLRLAEDGFSKLEDYENLLAVYRLVSFVYADLGAYELSVSYNLKRLWLAERLDDQRTIGAAQNNLAVIHAEYGDLDKALYYYNQAFKIAQDTGNSELERIISNNLSRLTYKLGDYHESLTHGLKALALFHENDLTDGLIELYHTLAYTYSKLHDPDQAFGYAHQALTLAEKEQSEYWQVFSLLALGRLYVENHMPQQSLAYLQHGLDLAQKNTLPTALEELHQTLAGAYKQLGDYPQALFHHEQFHDLHTQIFSDKSVQQLRNLEIVHRTTQAYNELERQKELREQDRQTFERLTALQQQFVHSASHDMKTPLTSIRLNVDMALRHPDFKPSLQKYMERIAAAAHRMNDLIVNVLDLAMLDAKRAITLEPVKLDEFLQFLTEEYQAYTETKRVNLRANLNATANTVQMERAQMMQAVGNLVTNAVKYNKEGGEVLIASELVADGVCIKVQDTGIGIPPEALPHIFEPFYRVSSAKSQEVEGTGLGLHICNRIIEQHRGKLMVESTVGEGTIFKVILPIA